MLGEIYAVLGALTFAVNNATSRRGVITGSVLQGMAITVPVGLIGFLVLALATGGLGRLADFPLVAVLWLAPQGIGHFVCGRYFNYKANQLIGTNLAAPVVQLQVVVAMALAVLALHETFTVLQLIGTIVMLVGSFATQTRQPAAKPGATFVPRLLPGYLCGTLSALFYGVSPLLVRQAFRSTEHPEPILGGVIAYTAALLFFGLVLLLPRARKDVVAMQRNNAGWFLASGLLVAASQAFVYASLALAPLMVVTPLLQLSLIFRLGLSQWLNRRHEIMNIGVLVAAFAAVAGSVLVALDTDALLQWTHTPSELTDMLSFRLTGR
jgi:drug/metabolite transporter (DMT)-like permease